MKRIIIVSLFSWAPLCIAQTYHIDWYVIGSGGGHSQSSNYQIDGTIGQPSVGQTSSSNYRIEAGFWVGTTTLGPVCSYIVGDANNSHSFTGLDITYSVRYFKGGPVPPYTCDCPPHGVWYVSGDVNGSCSFTGLDITYMVRYFKGGPAAIPCPDCPPAGLLFVPKPGEKPAPAIQPKLVPILKAKGAVKASN
jgi:hypothetical protein